MSVVMTPVSGGSVPAGYFADVADARTLGVTLTALPSVTAMLACSDDELAALCMAATLDIDSAMPYQGRKYDSTQERQFPRYANAIYSGVIRTPSEYQIGYSSNVWDWDDTAAVAVVPPTVLQAVLLQAASIKTNPNFRGRLEAIQSGLAAQSVGSVSETYLAPGSIPGGMTGLCDRAQKLMERYRLRSGGLL